MGILPEYTTLNKLSSDARTFCGEVKNYFIQKKIIDKNFAVMLKSKLADKIDQPPENISEFYLAVFFAAKELNLPLLQVLRFVIISIVMIASQLKDFKSSLIRITINNISCLLASWMDVREFENLSSEITRAKSHAFKYLDHVGIKRYSQLRIAIDQGFVDGYLDCWEILPVRVEWKERFINKLNNEFDKTLGNFFDYIFNGFWP